MLRCDDCLEVKTETAVAIRTPNLEAHQLYYREVTLSTHWYARLWSAGEPGAPEAYAPLLLHPLSDFLGAKGPDSVEAKRKNKPILVAHAHVKAKRLGGHHAAPPGVAQRRG